MAPRLRALCTQKPATAGSTGKEVAAEPTTTNRNKDGVATYNYGESLNLPEVTKEQAENAYLEATDVKRAMTPPISVAVEARDDMLKDRFTYVASMPTRPEPRTRRQSPRQACSSRVRALPWTDNLNPANRAIYAGADGAVEPEVGAHATRNTQHATRNTQHRTRNTQHATPTHRPVPGPRCGPAPQPGARSVPTRCPRRPPTWRCLLPAPLARRRSRSRA